MLCGIAIQMYHKVHLLYFQEEREIFITKNGEPSNIVTVTGAELKSKQGSGSFLPHQRASHVT